MVRVGSTFKSVCPIAGVVLLRRSDPKYRYVFPSIRTKPCIDCTVPVQWRVGPSVSLSFIDQMLKYGSCAINGTAGGRIAPGRMWTVVRARRKVTERTNEFFIETQSITPAGSCEGAEMVRRGLRRSYS